jgi:hypothetical protein
MPALITGLPTVSRDQAKAGERNDGDIEDKRKTHCFEAVESAE